MVNGFAGLAELCQKYGIDVEHLLFNVSWAAFIGLLSVSL